MTLRPLQPGEAVPAEERVMEHAWCAGCMKAWAVRRGSAGQPLCGSCWLKDWKLTQEPGQDGGLF